MSKKNRNTILTDFILPDKKFIQVFESQTDVDILEKFYPDLKRENFITILKIGLEKTFKGLSKKIDWDKVIPSPILIVSQKYGIQVLIILSREKDSRGFSVFIQAITSGDEIERAQHEIAEMKKEDKDNKYWAWVEVKDKTGKPIPFLKYYLEYGEIYNCVNEVFID